MGLPVASALAAEPAVGSQMVSDALGTHAAGQAELPDSGVAPVTAQADCTGSGSFGGYFNTYLGSGWTSLTARTGPCTSASGTGAWTTGEQIWVSTETHGQFICRGSLTYGYGSDVWFSTPCGWAWSGGTNDARWGGSC
jgi:hypothetical protein